MNIARERENGKDSKNSESLLRAALKLWQIYLRKLVSERSARSTLFLGFSHVSVGANGKQNGARDDIGKWATV